MKYQIMGTTMPAVEIQFDRPGESVYTQSGGMTWMTDGVQMSTNAKGGLMKGLGPDVRRREYVYGYLHGRTCRKPYCVRIYGTR